MHLLKLFAFNNSEEYAREIQMVLTRWQASLLQYRIIPLCASVIYSTQF